MFITSVCIWFQAKSSRIKWQKLRRFTKQPLTATPRVHVRSNKWSKWFVWAGTEYSGWTSRSIIRPCHKAAILSRETERALFCHAKPRNGNHGDEAKRGKSNLFGPPGQYGRLVTRKVKSGSDPGSLSWRRMFTPRLCLKVPYWVTKSWEAWVSSCERS